MPVDNLRVDARNGDRDRVRARNARLLPPSVHMSDRAVTLHRYVGLPHPHRPYYRFVEEKEPRDGRRSIDEVPV
jgi:hypothetical protein